MTKQEQFQLSNDLLQKIRARAKETAHVMDVPYTDVLWYELFKLFHDKWDMSYSVAYKRADEWIAKEHK